MGWSPFSFLLFSRTFLSLAREDLNTSFRKYIYVIRCNNYVMWKNLREKSTFQNTAIIIWIKYTGKIQVSLGPRRYWISNIDFFLFSYSLFCFLFFFYIGVYSLCVCLWMFHSFHWNFCDAQRGDAERGQQQRLQRHRIDYRWFTG